MSYLFNCATWNTKIQECLFCNVLSRLQKLIAEFSGDFDCSCLPLLPYVPYYAWESVLQPLHPYVYLNANAQICLCAIF